MDGGEQAQSPRGDNNPNRAVYDKVAQDWEVERQPVDYGGVDAFAGSLREDFQRGNFREERHQGEEHRGEGHSRNGSGSVCFDLGCGPGWYAARLPEPVVAVDSSLEMLRAVTRWAPNAMKVAADLQHLPFRSTRLGEFWLASAICICPSGKFLWRLLSFIELLRWGLWRSWSASEATKSGAP